MALEYRVEKMGWVKKPAAIEQQLNVYGAEGWEVAAVTEKTVILMRPEKR